MSTIPLTPPHLNIISACAKALATTQPFATRAEQVLGILRAVVSYHDARLTYWRPANDDEETAVTVLTNASWSAPWDDDELAKTRQHNDMTSYTTTISVAHPAGEVVAETMTVTGIPIRWQESVLGVLEFRGDADNALLAGDIATIQAILPLLAAEIDHTLSTLSSETTPADEQALVTFSKHLDLAQLLSRLRQDFDPPLPLHSLLPLILARGIEYTGAEAGSIVYVDHDRQELELVDTHGYTVTLLPDISGEHKRHRWSWESGIAGKVARSARSILMREVTQDVDYFYETKPEIRAKLAIPITVDGRAEAVLILDSTRSNAFGDNESALALGVAEAAVQPLRRALRYQEMLERSTQLSQVFHSIPSGLVLIDRHGQVLRHNPSFLQMWGLQQAQVGANFRLPFDILSLILPRFHDSAAFSDFCTKGQATPDQEFAIHLKLRNPHQELSIMSVPTRDSSEQITGRLWVIHDLTREKEADRLKTEFTSMVSHELRTPLTSIMGYSDILLTREFSADDQRRFLKILRQEAENLDNLVNDILDFARIEANTVRINRWTVPLQELSGDLSRQLQRQHVFDKHTITVDIASDTPPVHADKDRVRQIITNLLTNAAKYSPEGGEIVMRIRELTDLPDQHPTGRFVCISVTDTGIGIAPDHLQRIWDRFMRVDNSNTKSIGGTGLGLSIVKGLVELQGGRVWATSVLNKGSTFSFTLPVAGEIIRRQ
ncbi:MAG: hypothetical protein RL076_793 [Chloroflexota bacterium]|jgi:signal transduction histidine kinase